MRTKHVAILVLLCLPVCSAYPRNGKAKEDASTNLLQVLNVAVIARLASRSGETNVPAWSCNTKQNYLIRGDGVGRI